MRLRHKPRPGLLSSASASGGLLGHWRFPVSTAVLYDDRLVLRSLVRAPRVPLNEILQVQVKTGMVGFYSRDYLLLQLLDRSELRFKSLNSEPGYDYNAVRRLARYILQAGKS